MTVIYLLKQFEARKAEVKLARPLMALHEKLLTMRAADEHSCSEDINAFK
jgi:hypothetical protein